MMNHADDQTTTSTTTRPPEVLTVDITCGLPQRLVPMHIRDRPPSYYIVAGLVFTAVTVPYLKSEYGKDYDYDAPVKLLDTMLHAQAEEEGQQVVMLSQVLASEVNVGYEDLMNTTVKALNGTDIKNLRQLMEMVEQCTDPFLHLDLDYHQVLVLETELARKSTPEILETHRIARDRSDDLC